MAYGGLTTYVSGEGEDRIFFDGVLGKDQTSRHVLTLFAVGEPAREWTTLSDDAILERVMAELDKFYDGQASANYIQHRVQNWDKVPFIRGAYALVADTDTIEQPVGTKLFLATDSESMVHSAALSGRRAAVEVVSSLF